MKEKLQAGEERRKAFFMGLGDIVFPGILVATVYMEILVGYLLPCLVLVGTLVGFSVLMTFVHQRKTAGRVTTALQGAFLVPYFEYIFFGHARRV